MLFAVAWSQDRPDPQLFAQRSLVQPNMCWTPRKQPSFDHISRILTDPEPVHVAEEIATVVPPAVPHSTALAAASEVSLVAVSQSITLVRDDLHGSLESLMQHVSQLPMGLPSGEYRIVDSHGGTGWLRVRQTAAFPAIARDHDLIVTEADGETLRFIHLATTVQADSQEVLR